MAEEKSQGKGDASKGKDSGMEGVYLIANGEVLSFNKTSKEELLKIASNDVHIPEEMRHFLPPERLAALKEHESAEMSIPKVSRPLWDETLKDRLFVSSSKEGNFFSWMFLDKIFSPKRSCSNCGARGTGKLPPGDNSLELFVTENGLVGKQNILCSSCAKVESIISCGKPDEIPTDARLMIKGEQIRDLSKKISHHEVLHDLMELLHIAAIEEPVVKNKSHLQLAEFLLNNARKICEQWCKMEYRELRLKKFLRFYEEALLITYNPSYMPDCSAEYREMYEMMGNSFRQNRDHIHTILQAIRDTLIDSPSRSFCMLWMGIAMMHADNYKKFKEKYDPRSYMRVDEGEYWGLHDRYLGLDAPLGVKKIPIVFVLFEIPRFYHYVEFLEKKCGKRPKVYLTEEERYKLTRVDKEAKKRGFMHPKKSGVMISPHAHLDFLVRQEELIKMTRNKEQDIEAKKKASKKLSSTSDGSGSSTKKSSKVASSSVKKFPNTDTPDSTVTANKKDGVAVLPSIDKIMSIARECQIRVDDQETRGKVIAAGFKAMKENETKRRAENEKLMKVAFGAPSDTKHKPKEGKKDMKSKRDLKKEHSKARPEPPSKARPEPPSKARPEPLSKAHPESSSKAHPEPPSKAHPEPPSKAHPEPPSKAHPEPPSKAHPEHTSKACGEDVATVQQESSSKVNIVDSPKVQVNVKKPMKKNIDDSFKNIRLTNGIDSGKRDKSQNLDSVDKTDDLPPVPAPPDNVHPTSASAATTHWGPSTSANGKLDALEKEPVVKLKSEADLIQQKEKLLTAMKDAETKAKPPASKVKSGAKSPALEERRKIIRSEMLAEARVKMALSMKDSPDSMPLSHVFSSELADTCDEVVESLMFAVNRSRRAIDKELFDPTLLSVEDYRAIVYEEFKAHERRGMMKRKFRVLKPEIDPLSPLAKCSLPKHPRQGLPDLGGKISPASLMCAHVGTEHLRAQGYKVDTDSPTVAIVADRQGVIYQIIDGIDTQEELEQYIQKTYKISKKAMTGGTGYLTMPSKDNPGGIIAQPEIQDDLKYSGNPKKARKKARKQAQLTGPKPKKLAGKTVTIGEHTYTPEDVKALSDGTHPLFKTVKEVDESIDPMDEVALKAAHPQLKHVENTIVAPPDEEAFMAVVRKMMSPIPLEGVDPTVPRHIIPSFLGHPSDMEGVGQIINSGGSVPKKTESTASIPTEAVKATNSSTSAKILKSAQNSLAEILKSARTPAEVAESVQITPTETAESTPIEAVDDEISLETKPPSKEELHIAEYSRNFMKIFAELVPPQILKKLQEMDHDTLMDHLESAMDEAGGLNAGDSSESSEEDEGELVLPGGTSSVTTTLTKKELLGMPLTDADADTAGPFSSQRKQMRMLDAMGIPYRIDTSKVIHPTSEDGGVPQVSILSKITLLPFDKPKEKKPVIETEAEPKMTRSQRKKAKRREMVAQTKVAATPSSLLRSRNTSSVLVAPQTLISSSESVGDSNGSIDDMDEVESTGSTNGSSRSRTTARDRFKTCVNCNQLINDRIQLCAGCKRVAYCNYRCQKAHWKTHKHTCSYALKKDPKDRTG